VQDEQRLLPKQARTSDGMWGSRSPSEALQPPPAYDRKPSREHIGAVIVPISTRPRCARSPPPAPYFLKVYGPALGHGSQVEVADGSHMLGARSRSERTRRGRPHPERSGSRPAVDIVPIEVAHGQPPGGRKASGE
jgi:hypothetical protein